VISAGESVYELHRRSAWRSERELLKDGALVGSIRKERRNVVGMLPSDLSLPLQAFVGFVVLTLWHRDAAASSGAAGTAASATH
jgi:hypothetical protein